MDAFFRTHAYLVEHTNAPVRRGLMDEINWDEIVGCIAGDNTIFCALRTDEDADHVAERLKDLLHMAG